MTPATLQRRLLRTKDAAEYLCMSEWKLRRVIQAGELSVVRYGEGTPFLLDVRDLDRYIEEHKQKLDLDSYLASHIQPSS
jgi:excisionase family DNA binding protein